MSKQVGAETRESGLEDFVECKFKEIHKRFEHSQELNWNTSGVIMT